MVISYSYMILYVFTRDSFFFFSHTKSLNTFKKYIENYDKINRFIKKHTIFFLRVLYLLFAASSNYEQQRSAKCTPSPFEIVTVR